MTNIAKASGSGLVTEYPRFRCSQILFTAKNQRNPMHRLKRFGGENIIHRKVENNNNSNNYSNQTVNEKQLAILFT